MKKTLITLTLTLMAFTANAQTYTYDVNNDGLINITDVSCLVNKILGELNPGEEQPSYLTCPDDKHPHLIDLGLPSGTKWACCNVGATKPEGYGGYYAWGETEEKSIFNDVTYLYSIGDDTNGDGWYEDYHSIEGTYGLWQQLGDDIAGTEYDVAYEKWGSPWRLPSFDQINELLDNCSYSWTILNGYEGGLFTGPNGGTIFLPATGSYWGNELYEANNDGFYWSSTPIPTSLTNTYYLHCYSSDVYWSDDGFRYYGKSVRPVYVDNTYKPLVLSKSFVEINVGESATVEINTDNGSYSVSSSDSDVATVSLTGNIITIIGISDGFSLVKVKNTQTGLSAIIQVKVVDDGIAW